MSLYWPELASLALGPWTPAIFSLICFFFVCVCVCVRVCVCVCVCLFIVYQLSFDLEGKWHRNFLGTYQLLAVHRGL